MKPDFQISLIERSLSLCMGNEGFNNDNSAEPSSGLITGGNEGSLIEQGISTGSDDTASYNNSESSNDTGSDVETGTDTQQFHEEQDNSASTETDTGTDTDIQDTLLYDNNANQDNLSEWTEQSTPFESVIVYEKPSARELIPWVMMGALGGCILGIVLWSLFTKAMKKRKYKPSPKALKVVTLQGLGARENQQDSLAASDPAQYKEQGVLLCVADGMGGLKNGSMLSRTAVTAVMNKYATIDKSDPERMLAALVQSAVAAVNMMITPNYGSGGTTLLLGFVKEGRFYCASVGDSRICLLRDGKLIHLNRPHVFEDELLLRYFNGEISYENARNYNKKGGLTSYLGMGALKYVDFPTYHVSIQKGDRYILMSDGVFNALNDEELAIILGKRAKSISTILNKEIENKKKRFQDNYSAAVLIAD